MKKITYVLLAVLIQMIFINTKAYSTDLIPNTHYAIVLDSKDNTVLYEKKGHENIAMASTTKIITSLIALNYCDLNETVTISKHANSVRGAKVGFSNDEKLPMRELVYGLMLRSGNDAAIAIAEHIGGSVKGFSKVMNDFSNTIGLIDTNFESPHGLDSSMHFSSAYDLAIASSKAMKNKMFNQIVSTKEITRAESGFSRDYRNINKILWKIPNANGIKTGYTGQAGKCLVTSVKYKDRNLIIVVLNSPNRWEDTETLYQHVIKNVI